MDKKVIRQAELAEVGRYRTTRSFMPLLWSQPAKTPRALDDPARRTHEIDDHIRMLVVDLPDVESTDEANVGVLITNKLIRSYHVWRGVLKLRAFSPPIMHLCSGNFLPLEL